MWTNSGLTNKKLIEGTVFFLILLFPIWYPSRFSLWPPPFTLYPSLPVRLSQGLMTITICMLTPKILKIQLRSDGCQIKTRSNPDQIQIKPKSFIISGEQTRESLILILPVPFPQNFLSLSEEVKKLGKIYDLENSFDNHITKISHSLFEVSAFEESHEYINASILFCYTIL